MTEAPYPDVVVLSQGFRSLPVLIHRFSQQAVPRRQIQPSQCRAWAHGNTCKGLAPRYGDGVHIWAFTEIRAPQEISRLI